MPLAPGHPASAPGSSGTLTPSSSCVSKDCLSLGRLLRRPHRVRDNWQRSHDESRCWAALGAIGRFVPGLVRAFAPAAAAVLAFLLVFGLVGRAPTQWAAIRSTPASWKARRKRCAGGYALGRT